MDMHTTIEELLVFYAVSAEADVLVQVFWVWGGGGGMQSHLCTGVFHGDVRPLSVCCYGVNRIDTSEAQEYPTQQF
jgi:hypothetical protein